MNYCLMMFESYILVKDYFSQVSLVVIYVVIVVGDLTKFFTKSPQMANYIVNISHGPVNLNCSVILHRGTQGTNTQTCLKGN